MGVHSFSEATGSIIFFKPGYSEEPQYMVRTFGSRSQILPFAAAVRKVVELVPAITPSSVVTPAASRRGRAAFVAPITLQWEKASCTHPTAAASVESCSDPSAESATNTASNKTDDPPANWKSARRSWPSAVTAPPTFGLERQSQTYQQSLDRIAGLRTPTLDNLLCRSRSTDRVCESLDRLQRS